MGTESEHHDTIRDMMATSSHVFSFIFRGGTLWVYGGRLFVISARTNKRHHHPHQSIHRGSGAHPGYGWNSRVAGRDRSTSPSESAPSQVFEVRYSVCLCVCFITAGPITKLFASGEEESGGHVL